MRAFAYVKVRKLAHEQANFLTMVFVFSLHSLFVFLTARLNLPIPIYIASQSHRATTTYLHGAVRTRRGNLTETYMFCKDCIIYAIIIVAPPTVILKEISFNCGSPAKAVNFLASKMAAGIVKEAAKRKRKYVNIVVDNASLSS